MSQFNHRNFLWNKDHNFSSFKNQTITKDELIHFLDCNIEDTTVINFSVNANGLLIITDEITLTKEKFLIVAKDNNGNIIDEALDRLTLTAGNYKEINFGWLIDQSFTYLSSNRQWAQDLQRSEEHIVIQNNKVTPATKLILQDSWSPVNAIVTDSDPNLSKDSDYYRVQMSSFSGWSNNNNKLLEFLSWPNKTLDQTTSKCYFLTDSGAKWGKHNNSRSVMNWGTNGVSIMGIAAGTTDTAELVDNILFYQGQEYLIPGRKGTVFRIHRLPANDLTLPEAVYTAQANTDKIDMQYLFGYVPTAWGWHSEASGIRVSIGGNNEGYLIDLSTQEKPLYPWVEQSSLKTNSYNPFSFLNDFYREFDLKEYIEDYPQQMTSTRQGCEKIGMLKINSEGEDVWSDWLPENRKKSYCYQSKIIFPTVELSALRSSMQSVEVGIDSNLILTDCTHTYNIPNQFASEHQVNINFKPISPYGRRYSGWFHQTGASKEEIHIDLVLKNFCLLPGENIQNLFNWDAKIEKFNGKTWEKDISAQDKNVPQNNFVGYRLLLGWNNYLIDPATSEFLAPSDSKDRPVITTTIDGKSLDIQMFASCGSWDLLTNRIVPLSCIFLFETEQVQTNRPHCFSFKDSSYIKLSDAPVFLFNKSVSNSDLDLTTQAPVWYWPCVSKNTTVLYQEGLVGYEWYYKNKKEYKYRLSGQDYGAVAMFVEPNVEQTNFNQGNTYGWYWTDEAIEFKIVFNEDTSYDELLFTNYSLQKVALKVINGYDLDSNNFIKEVPILSSYKNLGYFAGGSLFINQKLVFENLADETGPYYNKLWKITQDNEVYCDGVFYGTWTDEGIQPYENE